MNGRIKIFYNSNDEATIDIEGIIGESRWWEDDKSKENTNARIKKELEDIKAINAKQICVNIHSLGGDVNHALAIYDALKDHPATVTTKITGMCASAATVIMMAGETRKMSNNALILIHKCSSFIWGNENDIQAELNDQKTINQRIINIYVSNNKDNEKEIEKLMNENNGYGKWITAQEAKKLDLINDIYNEEKSKKVALFSKKDFNDYKLPDLPAGYEHFIQSDDNNSILARIEKFITDKFNSIETQSNNKTNIQMKNLFPVLVLLLALDEKLQFDAEKGLTLDQNQLKKIEDELAKISALEAEKTNLETEKTNLENKIKTQQEIIEKIPVNTKKIDSEDEDDEPETFEKKMKNNAYYQGIANELGKKL